MRSLVLALSLLVLTLPIKSAESFKLKTPVGGFFAIQTTNGLISTESLIGQNYLLYFGFSHCPSICPTALWKIKHALSKLPKQILAKTKVLFISVDNERDTVDSLKGYLSKFGSEFIGGVDNDSTLQNAISLYGGSFSRLKNQKGQLIVNHSDKIYLINTEGEWVETFDTASKSDDIVMALTKKTPPNKKAIEAVRTVKKLGAVSTCNLQSKSCNYQSDEINLTLDLTARPIKTLKDTRALITYKSHKYIPLELDFEGEQQNMGLIRPALVKEGPGYNTDQFALPICELDKMDWSVKVILKEIKSGELVYVDFKLTTHE